MLSDDRSTAWEDAAIRRSSAARSSTWLRPGGRLLRSPRRWGSAPSRSTPAPSRPHRPRPQCQQTATSTGTARRPADQRSERWLLAPQLQLDAWAHGDRPPAGRSAGWAHQITKRNPLGGPGSGSRTWRTAICGWPGRQAATRPLAGSSASPARSSKRPSAVQVVWGLLGSRRSGMSGSCCQSRVVRSSNHRSRVWSALLWAG
jgi:hypothetical protein